VNSEERARRVCMSMSSGSSWWCGLRPSSFNMDTEFSVRGNTFGGIFGSSAKPRSLRVQPSGLFMLFHVVVDSQNLFLVHT